MNRDDVFVERLGDFLERRAGTVHAGYLAETLERTSAAPQRRWWSSPERWLPMDLTMRPALFRPWPPRALAVLAVLALLIAALVVYAVGSQHRLPGPFGLARNGEIVVSVDGDLFAVDAPTGARRLLVGGPTFDFGAVFSRDGTKLLFLRGAPAGCGEADCGLILVLADADGANVRELTAGTPMLDWVDWSPDGTQIAFEGPRPTGTGNGHAIRVVAVGDGDPHTIDLGRPVHEVTWRMGAEPTLVFRGDQPTPVDPPPGLFEVRPDGTGLRELSPTPPQHMNDYEGIAVSLDGTRATYTTTEADERFHVHVLDLITGDSWLLPAPQDAAQVGAAFSADGRSVVYVRIVGGFAQLVVAPADGSATGVGVGPAVPFHGDVINNYGFSPNGNAVFANYDNDKTVRLVPVDGSPPVVLGQGELALVGIQRLAP